MQRVYTYEHVLHPVPPPFSLPHMLFRWLRAQLRSCRKAVQSKRDSGRDGSGPSKRREGLNKKYGFGGQKNKKATRNDGKGGGDVGFSTSSKAMKARSGAKTGKRPGKDTRNKNRQQQKGGKKRGPGR